MTSYVENVKNDEIKRTMPIMILLESSPELVLFWITIMPTMTMPVTIVHKPRRCCLYNFLFKKSTEKIVVTTRLPLLTMEYNEAGMNYSAKNVKVDVKKSQEVGMINSSGLTLTIFPFSTATRFPSS